MKKARMAETSNKNITLVARLRNRINVADSSLGKFNRIDIRDGEIVVLGVTGLTPPVHGVIGEGAVIVNHHVTHLPEGGYRVFVDELHATAKNLHRIPLKNVLIPLEAFDKVDNHHDFENGEIMQEEEKPTEVLFNSLPAAVKEKIQLRSNLATILKVQNGHIAEVRAFCKPKDRELVEELDKMKNDPEQLKQKIDSILQKLKLDF